MADTEKNMAEEEKTAAEAQDVKEEASDVPTDGTASCESREEASGEGGAEEETAPDAGNAEKEDAEKSADGGAESREAGGGARKFFGKKKEKKDKKDEKIEELTDRLTRQMAEFDNYRKRTEKEKAGMYVVGARDVIEKILPVVDNFERGLAGADAGDPFVDGMNKIYKQLTAMLTDLGVTPIESVGTEFDPNIHNAVMHVEDESVGENIVVEEFQKGYKYKDSVVRHSMVKVAN